MTENKPPSPLPATLPAGTLVVMNTVATWAIATYESTELKPDGLYRGGTGSAYQEFLPERVDWASLTDPKRRALICELQSVAWHAMRTDELIYVRDALQCGVVGGDTKPESHDEGHPHLYAGKFQSDKYPACPRGKVPLSTKDPTAQDLLWEYAQRRRSVDAEFAADLEFALKANSYKPPAETPSELKADAVAAWINADVVRAKWVGELSSVRAYSRAASEPSERELPRRLNVELALGKAFLQMEQDRDRLRSELAAATKRAEATDEELASEIRAHAAHHSNENQECARLRSELAEATKREKSERQQSAQLRGQLDGAFAELQAERAKAGVDVRGLERSIRELRDSVGDTAKNHVPCSPLASRIEQSLTDILESLQPASPQPEPAKAGK